MADLARIKNNVRKMAAQNAPESDIDGYIASEGVTIDDVRNFGDRASEQPVAARSGQHLSFEEGQALLDREERDERANSLSGRAGAFLTGVADFPIVGPALVGGAQRAAAGISSLIDGESYEDNLKQAQQITTDAQEANPWTTTAGRVAGSIGVMAPIGMTATGARALGISGPSLLGRAAASAGSSAAISGADTLARGGDEYDALVNSGIGGAIGGAIPLAGAGINAGIRAAADKFGPTLNAIRNPSDEAARRVGSAITRDAAANPASVMNAADEVVASQAGIPLVNADRGGEVTRALARSVGNQSPEARAMIEKTASDRFGGQSQRAVDFIKRITGNNADDLALQESVRSTARFVNAKAYKEAYSAPNAQAIYTKGLQDLMQSPSLRKAVSSVPRRSADRGAVEGFKEIANPFHVNSQGAYVLRQKADGTFVAPSLQFWDQVKRNLDSQIGTAKRAGDNTRTADLRAIKERLVGELDTAVPSFKAARQGAWQAFNAEDAIDAGRKFANNPRLIPEAQRAIQKLNRTEKDGFATGFASELIDRIKASGDRTNSINTFFKNQASREQMELVFGPAKAKEIEAYVRVEDLADRLRGAMGNSTTARQLVELGLGGLAGYSFGGDLQSAGAGALLAAGAGRGARYIGQRADAKTMEEVAKLLTQDNVMSLRSAVHRAAQRPAFMAALERLSDALAIPSRGLAVSAGD